MKTTLPLLLAATLAGGLAPAQFADRFGAPEEPSTEPIRDINTHIATDQDYQRASPVDRLLMLSQWVSLRRIPSDAVQLQVRREATAFLRQQAGFNRGIGVDNLDPEVMEMQYQQLRGGGLAGAGGVAGAGPGAAGGIGLGLPNQKLVQEEIAARRTVEETMEDVMLQREFGGMLAGYYMLRNLAVRGQPLQDIELPRDLMDDVVMRMVYGDPRWEEGTPRERLEVLREIKLNRIWSPMMAQIAHAHITAVLYEETKDRPADEVPLAALITLREYKKKELIEWGLFHELMERRHILAFLDQSPEVQRGAPMDTLKLLRTMEREQLISSMSRTEFELPYAMQHIQADAAFHAADEAGRKAYIKNLRDDNLIDFHSVAAIEAAFGLRGRR